MTAFRWKFFQGAIVSPVALVYISRRSWQESDVKLTEVLANRKVPVGVIWQIKIKDGPNKTKNISSIGFIICNELYHH